MVIIYTNWVIENMLVPGHIENFILIIDCSDLSQSELPISKLKPVMDLMDQLYKGRTIKFLFLNVNWLLRGIFRIVSFWVSQTTQDSIHVYSRANSLNGLLEYLPLDDIEQKFGGNKEDISFYFPPIY